MFQNALNNYKRINDITITNKEIRNSIYMMLRQQIAISYLETLNFSTMPFRKIYSIIRYCKNFMKDNKPFDAKALKSEIIKALDSQLLSLPTTPDLIPEYILNTLPFTLPIKNRSYTRSIVSALHKIFKFITLPDTFFEKLDPLPMEPEELHPTIRDLFPITDRKALQNLAYYKKKLRDFYEVTTIPKNFFDLPKPKQPLPSTYQELNHAVRNIFPLDRNNPEMPILKAVTILKEYYTFRYLPNDFLKPRPKLPTDPHKIKTLSSFTYPIRDDETAKEFLNQIKFNYNFNLPLPIEIMEANPTEKPRLPQNPEDITQYNITIPITTPKQLTETARLLRQDFYFYKIPDSWIEINKEQENSSLENNKPPLPEDIQTINEFFQNLESNSDEITFPIKQHSDVPDVIYNLQQHFSFKHIPDKLLNLLPFPTPTWEIFSNNNEQ
jgi:hypothetical protein